MSDSSTTFTCPTCGTSKTIQGRSKDTTCEVCGDSFALQYNQSCPGCGITISGNTLVSHCPDCDSRLPKAPPVWNYSSKPPKCKFCKRPLSVLSAGHLRCPHCEYDYDFDIKKKKWFYNIRTHTCDCGKKLLYIAHSPTICSDCGREYELDPISDQWSKVVRHIDFNCPECGTYQRLDKGVTEARCTRCGQSYTGKHIQTCPRCKKAVVNAKKSIPCSNCGTKLPPPESSWTCTTPPGKCPVCGNTFKRTEGNNGTRLLCPACKLLRTFNLTTNRWEDDYGHLNCDCGKRIALKSVDVFCESCKSRHVLQPGTLQWKKIPKPYEPSEWESFDNFITGIGEAIDNFRTPTFRRIYFAVMMTIAVIIWLSNISGTGSFITGAAIIGLLGCGWVYLPLLVIMKAIEILFHNGITFLMIIIGFLAACILLCIHAA